MSFPARILPPCSPYQVVKSLHAAEAEFGAIDQHWDHPHPALERCPDFEAHQVVGVIDPPLPVLISQRHPLAPDQGPARCRQAPARWWDVPQQEDQDADGQGIEERLDPGHLRPHAAHGNQGRSKTREGFQDGELAGGHKDPFPLWAGRSVWPLRSRPAVRLAWRSCGNVDSTAHPGTLGQDGPKVGQTNLQRARSLDKGLAGLLDRVGAGARPPADWLEEQVISLTGEGMDTGDRTLLAGQPWR
jgi:hypothetical protein